MKYGFKLTMELKLKLLWYEEIIGNGIHLQQGNVSIISLLLLYVSV